MKNKVFRITLADGKTFTYPSISQLYEIHKSDIEVVMGTITNSFYTHDGIWNGKNGVTIERLDICQTIIKTGEVVKL